MDRHSQIVATLLIVTATAIHAQSDNSVPPPSAGRGPSAGPGGGLTPGVKLPPAPAKANPLDKITPVSDAMLQNPPAGDWLTWRRGFDYQGFSPLKQITKANVNNLRVAWTWTLPPGANEATPLVHDGVMLLHGFGDKVQALDAATGKELWKFDSKISSGQPVEPTTKICPECCSEIPKSARRCSHCTQPVA